MHSQSVCNLAVREFPEDPAVAERPDSLPQASSAAQRLRVLRSRCQAAEIVQGKAFFAIFRVSRLESSVSPSAEKSLLSTLSRAEFSDIRTVVCWI
jgi:hypothetical protein